VNPLCTYTGIDSTAQVGSNDDNTWFSRCHCGEVTCASGTYEEAVAALEVHRAPEE
jgi:hypothetical protein